MEAIANVVAAAGAGRDILRSMEFGALPLVAAAHVDEWRTWASIASAVVAGLALLVSLSNRRTARRALRLSERQEERRSPGLDLSLIEAVSWRPARGVKFCGIGMQVLAINPSDRDGALVGVDLHLTYTTPTGIITTVKVPHGPRGMAIPEVIEPLEIPAALPVNGAVSGWLVFKIDDGLTGGGPIDCFEAVVRDSRGPTESVQACLGRSSMTKRARRQPLSAEDVVPIVADAMIAGPVAEGVGIPLVILDTSERPDLEELIRVHQHLPPGGRSFPMGDR